MSKWLDDLLAEWRQRMLLMPPDEETRPLDQSDVGSPLGPLELLRKHVRAAGVVLRLTEISKRETLSRRVPVQMLSVPAALETPEQGCHLPPGSQFGRRQSRRVEDEASPQHVSPLWEVARQMRRPPAGPVGQGSSAAAGHVKSSTGKPAVDDIAALQSEIAHLKDSLAELLVENLLLKRQLESGIPFQAPDQKGVRRS